jgi:hypothetical protein
MAKFARRGNARPGRGLPQNSPDSAARAFDARVQIDRQRRADGTAAHGDNDQSTEGVMRNLLAVLTAVLFHGPAPAPNLATD